jgi:small subunit ribosomal protein S14
MARKGLIESNNRRLAMSERYLERRNALKLEILREFDIDKKLKLIQKLDSLPRNSSRTRYRNRCSITGRPRGYNKATGLCRIMARQLIADAKLAGFVKGRGK